ncbi:unnamed protein product [Microthlaspi erraticum]|uniref:SWIM-type domain-containing protein n=1 Tax=Microthlaspi erraticum TaxID=1685480 RepID=A0A6D2JAM7_9BRAS|nr:unnamed protein product [Microthlaspi erraticum]
MEGPSSQKSGQDEVKLILSTWICKSTGAWLFEADTIEGSSSINLSDDLKFRDLIDEVGKKLQILAENVSVKLAYQYPQWMVIDDGDGSTPQYITNDEEVQFFIQMPRHIEEVNLCVTLTAHVNEIPTVSTCNKKEIKKTNETEDVPSSETEETGDNSEDEWHQFAMSETPMTFPAFGSTQLSDLPPKHRHRMQTRATSISINEGASAIRLNSLNLAITDKGKGKAVVTDYGSSSDSDNEDDAVVPCLPNKNQRVPHNNNSTADVRRRLFQDGENSHSEGVNHGQSDEDDENNDYEPDQGRRFSRWGRFEEALHQILNDFTAELTLFGRDAPPVFSTYECDATLKHTCSVDARRNYHRLATTQVIGELMQSKFVGIKRGSSPSGIRKILLDEFHVNVSYWKAWCAREISMDNTHGSMAGSYALVPVYLALLQNANPGTICYLETVTDPKGGTRFKYCFIAYGAFVAGFQHMRKVIVIDGTSMKGRYGGVLLSACTQDGNFQIFPLAFAIVDSENNNAWQWFLEKLNTFVPDSPELVFVSDRHQSIYNGLERVFPLAHHDVCVVHLWRNIRSGYKPRHVANLVSAVARAFTIPEFNKKFLEIQKLNPGCAAYLVDIVMGWFAIRRTKPSSNEDSLTPHVKKIIEKKFEESTGLVVRAITQFEFQVQAQEGECFTVRLVEGTCSCMEYQQLGIPCVHAIAAVGNIKIPTEAIVCKAFYGNSWKNGFEGRIYPVPSVGNVEIGDGFRGELLPPDVKRPAGRPKKIRILSSGEFKVQIYLHYCLAFWKEEGRA